jgi:tyrosine-protein kinase Etk/Wzc
MNQAAPRVVSLRDLVTVLLPKKRLIGACTLAAAIVATAAAFIIPKKFTAETVIYTPHQPQSSLSSMLQFAGGGAAGLSGLDLFSGLGLRSTADVYIGILQSRTITDTIISRFDLKRVYDVEDFYAARKRLTQNTSIKSGKDTLIHIQVEDQSPQRSAQLANAYVEELGRQNSSVSLSEATQRRLFFEEQLAKSRDTLAAAEIALRNTQQTTGLVAPASQAEALLRSAAQLHVEILSRQAQLEGLRQSISDDNPRLQSTKREIAVLQNELARMEHGNEAKQQVSAGQLPQAGLEYLRKYRDVKYYETLYEILAKQYEAARLDEARAGSSIQIIDRAVPPERKSWPPRVLLILAASFFAAIASAFTILAKNAWQRNSAQF